MEIRKVLKLYESCRLCIGKCNSIIVDLQDKCYYAIGIDFGLFLEKCRNDEFENVIKDYQPEQQEIIFQNLQVLMDKNIIFFTDNSESFPDMSLKYSKSHFAITNAIVDIKDSKDVIEKVTDFANQLEHLGCEAIQIRLFSQIHADKLKSVIGLFENKRICSIEIVLPISSDLTQSQAVKIYKGFPRLTHMYLYNSKNNSTLHWSKAKKGGIFLFKMTEMSVRNCGVICKSNFSINIDSFTESQKFNSCLNRKISIDVDGNIKNCPSMKESFGNINITSLAEVIEKQEFKKYWNINKDKIHVCMDCEFRYICTDCRAYVENPEDILSKPLKCGYNPYTSEWSEWSTNSLKQKAIDLYGMRDMIEQIQPS